MRTNRMKEEAATFSALLDSLPCPALIVDREHRVRAVNTALRERGPERRVGPRTHCYELLHGRRRRCPSPGRDCPLERCLETGAPVLWVVLRPSNAAPGMELVAVLAFSAVRNNDRVGFIRFAEGVERYVPPRKGASHALRIVRDCLALRAGDERTDLAAALRFAWKTLRRRAILFLVSDFLCAGWQGPLALAARRHDVVAVRLLLPELVPVSAGLVRLRDPEGGRPTVVDTSSPRARAGYAARIAAWRERTETDLGRARVDRMDVPVPRAAGRDLVAGPILQFFRMRELRGAKR